MLVESYLDGFFSLSGSSFLLSMGCVVLCYYILVLDAKIHFSLTYEYDADRPVDPNYLHRSCVLVGW